MESEKLLTRFAVAGFALFGFAAPASTQPILSSLWPVEVGRSWEFDVRIDGPFDQVRTGRFTQTVDSQTEFPSGITAWCFRFASTVPLGSLPETLEGLSALEQRVWLARPELRESISAQLARRITVQPSRLLAMPEQCAFENGFLADDEFAVGIWGNSIGDWRWWWVMANPTAGSSFRRQIRVGVVDDAFLNGYVRTIDGVVTTPAGTFASAVIVDYVVEWGESTIVDGPGNVLGTASFETVGWVAFVPGVGPVATGESLGPAQIDCPACPPDVFETITTTMELRSTGGVGSEGLSFGSLKSRY